MSTAKPEQDQAPADYADTMTPRLALAVWRDVLEAERARVLVYLADAHASAVRVGHEPAANAFAAAFALLETLQTQEIR